MIAILCPGQGSQTPSFMSPWLEFEAFRNTVEALQEASGIKLIEHGTVSDADTIRDTAIAQPLIVAAGVATARLLEEKFGEDFSKVSAIAGHSVGEITAAIISGILTPDEGIKFVRERGEAMARAAALEPTGMAAVVGGDLELIEQRLVELDLSAANYNGGGQIVVAGMLSALGELQAEPPAGSRVIPLQVAGAFHTRFMQPAVSHMSQIAQKIVPSDPALKLWSNSDGHSMSNGSEFVATLVSQISSPVRWDKTMESMLRAGVTTVIELSPAGALSGLAKRAMPGVEIFSLKTPESLDALAEVFVRG